MTHTEVERPKPLSPQELGQRSFKAIERLQSGLRSLKNSAFKRYSVNAVFDNTKI